MALRISWEKEEAVLLIDAYLCIASGKASKAETIRQLSLLLRKRAMSLGIEVDETFRNENGISLQMQKIQHLFTGKYPGFSNASHLFVEMVDLYHNDKSSFDTILMAAKEIPNLDTSVQERFFTWLAEKVSPAQMSELYFAYSEIESFCLNEKILKKGLFESTSLTAISNIKQCCNSNKKFRHIYRKQLPKMQAAINHYYIYIKDIYPTTASDVVETHIERANQENPQKLSPTSSMSKTEKTFYSTQINRKNTQKDNDFYTWLVTSRGMAEASGRNYASAVSGAEQFAKDHHLDSWKIIEANDCETVNRTISALFSNNEFIERNKKQHNRFKAALKKYQQFRRSVVPAPVGQPNEEMDNSNHYKTILAEYFPKGFRADSNLDLKRFIRCFNDKYGANLNASDSAGRSNIREKILQAGVHHGSYVFSLDSLLLPETKERLFKYISRCFAERKKAIYYRALFEEFNEEFLGQRIYDENMLKAYLIHVNPDNYCFERNYMTKDKYLQLDPIEEVESCMIAQVVPLKMDTLETCLPHLPEDYIRWILQTTKEFIRNAPGEYFHVSLVDLSDDELEDISEIIKYAIKNNHFISGNELINAIKKKYPTMLERFPQFSMMGLRDAIAYYLQEKYSFNGNIISSLDRQLSMKEVFEEFAKSHSSFTIDELNVLKNEMNSVIYFDAVYKNCLRISQRQFVSRERASFDVQKTDMAIDCFCIGDYIPLQEIGSFAAFPDAGFPWNTYLLEHYVSDFSSAYKLLHIGYNADNCVGAIVKRKVPIDNFDDLIIDILSNSNIALNKRDALQYLCNMGYQARRRYSNIDQILIKARAKRGQ